MQLKYIKTTNLFIAILLLSFMYSLLPKEFTDYKNDIKVCFTPQEKCSKLIIQAIAMSKKSIYVHGYSMTSVEIAEALANARERGVEVRALLDKSNLKNKHSRIRDMQNSGIEVTIDSVAGIAHNKIMIIDEEYVITGSFNFTQAADTRNAENVLLIHNKQIADQYLHNWFYRLEYNLQKKAVYKR